jgi:SAM-dependent methyltransferase
MALADQTNLLTRLYAEQAEIRPDVYLHAHSRNQAVIQRQVQIFNHCAKYFDSANVVLDWGCRQGADACLMRMYLGDQVQVHGCDVDPPNYEAFFSFSRIEYRLLRHPYLLPYEDNTFDVVMGSGVLEHVPIDIESLKELYRVIRPQGRLIITMLPNRLSYTEFLNRRLGNPHHLRLYSHQEIIKMLMHTGFLPLESGYHQIIPTLSSPKGGIFDIRIASRFVESLWPLNSALEKVPILRSVATNIFVVAKKVEAFHG